MNIDSLRHYLLESLPPEIRAGWNSSLQAVPPVAFLAVILLLSLGLAWLWARLRRCERRDQARTDYFRGVSQAPNLQEAISRPERVLPEDRAGHTETGDLPQGRELLQACRWREQGTRGWRDDDGRGDGGEHPS